MLRRKREERKLQKLEDTQRFEKLTEERRRMWEEEEETESELTRVDLTSSIQPSFDAL